MADDREFNTVYNIRISVYHPKNYVSTDRKEILFGYQNMEIGLCGRYKRNKGKCNRDGNCIESIYCRKDNKH